MSSIDFQYHLGGQLFWSSQQTRLFVKKRELTSTLKNRFSAPEANFAPGIGIYFRVGGCMDYYSYMTEGNGTFEF